MTLYLLTYCEQLGYKSTFYVLLHFIYCMQCLINAKDLHSRHIPIITLVCIYNVCNNNKNNKNNNYYLILTSCCIQILKEVKNVKLYENYCSVYSAVTLVLKDRQTNRHDETEICCFEFYTDSATCYRSSWKSFRHTAKLQQYNIRH